MHRKKGNLCYKLTVLSLRRHRLTEGTLRPCLCSQCCENKWWTSFLLPLQRRTQQYDNPDVLAGSLQVKLWDISTSPSCCGPEDSRRHLLYRLRQTPTSSLSADQGHSGCGTSCIEDIAKSTAHFSTCSRQVHQSTGCQGRGDGSRRQRSHCADVTHAVWGYCFCDPVGADCEERRTARLIRHCDYVMRCGNFSARTTDYRLAFCSGSMLGLSSVSRTFDAGVHR
jgi:hypothetical protein